MAGVMSLAPAGANCRGAWSFLCIGTKRPDRALRAIRLFRQADAPPMILQQMTEANPFFFRDKRHEVELDLIRVGVFRESQPL